MKRILEISVEGDAQEINFITDAIHNTVKSIVNLVEAAQQFDNVHIKVGDKIEPTRIRDVPKST